IIYTACCATLPCALRKDQKKKCNETGLHWRCAGIRRLNRPGSSTLRAAPMALARCAGIRKFCNT
ncbi:hypothetical protein A2U01_0115512, partial [Trifolium medium]|nr:hypothetical protein [Trifolium medium]